ncbi:MAG TPA: YdeI/OmpD-associated family protein [Methylomirabilota bacterium]|nr:YdeI/OmpD-associated family protein [Methylomirabilota bacterium]
MPRKDARIDAYIAKAQPFARPILKHIRATVMSASPDLEETLKWGHPSFAYHGIVCGMAAFKQHVGFGFWKSKLILDTKGMPVDEAMGQFGRITSVSELPSKRELVGYVKKAMKLNEDGVVVKRATKPRAPIPMPPVFKAALAKAAKARAFFASLPPGHQREYLEWVTEAKTDATRDKRIATTIEWLTEGKRRNWKYDRK